MDSVEPIVRNYVFITKPLADFRVISGNLTNLHFLIYGSNTFISGP